MVDGAEAANTNYQAQKFYEVAKNWAMVKLTTITAPLIMFQKKFNALPNDVQEALLKGRRGISRLRARPVHHQ